MEKRKFGLRGNLFGFVGKSNKFHIISFNAPFMPEGLPQQSSIDSGGVKGIEIALRFCRKVGDYLKPHGYAILVIADFVDHGEVQKELENKFGKENVHHEDRLILYPCKTPEKIDLAYEVRWKDEIESRCGYQFETCWLGSEEFIAFKMRHYIARKEKKKTKR
jgi:hypothetical protein